MRLLRRAKRDGSRLSLVFEPDKPEEVAFILAVGTAADVTKFEVWFPNGEGKSLEFVDGDIGGGKIDA